MVFTLRLRTLTTRRWKLTRFEDLEDVGELYDLEEDPGEVVNRWADPGAAATKAELLAELDATMNHKVDAGPMVGVVG
jgi:arylsulfatase A-like enzyme